MKFYAIYDIYGKKYYYEDSYGKEFGGIEYAMLFSDCKEAIGQTKMLGNGYENYEIHEIYLELGKKYKIIPDLMLID